MRIVLWVLQVLLAALFAWHGQMMVFPPAEYVEMMNASMPVALRYFIGVAELLAAVGLILPALTRILPVMTVVSGAGLMIVMASATVSHLYRGEVGNVIFCAVVFLLLTFVTYMRWKVKPIAPRSLQTSRPPVAAR